MSWGFAFSDALDEAPPPFPSRFRTVECTVLPLWLSLVYHHGFVLLSAKKDGGQLQNPGLFDVPRLLAGEAASIGSNTFPNSSPSRISIVTDSEASSSSAIVTDAEAEDVFSGRDLLLIASWLIEMSHVLNSFSILICIWMRCKVSILLLATKDYLNECVCVCVCVFYLYA